MARGRFVNRPYDIVMTPATAIHHCINIKHARKNELRPVKWTVK